MNRNGSSYGLRESLRSIFPNRIGNGNSNGESYSSTYSHHRRAQGLGSKSHKDNSPSSDENLGLFSRNRRLSFGSATDVSIKIGKLSIASSKHGRNGTDDLLNSPDSGKHDYDWLLTPPGTPVFPSSDSNAAHPSPFTPKISSLARSTSASKFSRLSVSQSESSHIPKPARTSSASRPSTSSKSSGNLNTSSLSVSSYTRPSSPISRSPTIARPSTPTSRSSVYRASTPSSSRPISFSPIEKPPSQSYRSSTPTSRSSLNSNCSHSTPRPSTPTRRSPSKSLPPAPTSRPSSPSSRRSIHHVICSDPPLGRSLSAGRSRPGSSVSKNISEISSPATPRRPSSPTPRLSDVTKSRVNSPDFRRNIKLTSTITEGIETARTITKKASDMTARYTESRSGPGGTRSSLFPSIKSSPTRGQSLNRSFVSESSAYSAKLKNRDIYESSRYDTMLLKEDVRNTYWLHSIDDMSDQGSMFDCGFEPLPEPFAL